MVERNGAVILLVAGEIDLSTAPLFEEKLLAAEATEATTVVVDLEHVSFIDSTGLRVLIKHAVPEAGRSRARHSGVRAGAPAVRDHRPAPASVVRVSGRALAAAGPIARPAAPRSLGRGLGRDQAS